MLVKSLGVEDSTAESDFESKVKLFREKSHDHEKKVIKSQEKKSYF